MFDFIFELIWGSELAKMVPFLISSYWFYLIMHIGLNRTVKIFKKIELGVSMARLTSNLVNASQIKWKKWKKDFEIDEIWTPDQP